MGQNGSKILSDYYQHVSLTLSSERGEGRLPLQMLRRENSRWKFQPTSSASLTLVVPGAHLGGLVRQSATACATTNARLSEWILLQEHFTLSDIFRGKKNKNVGHEQNRQ